MAVEVFEEDNDIDVTKYVISIYPDSKGYLAVEHLDLREDRSNPDTCDIGEIMAIRDYLPSAIEKLDKLIGLLVTYRSDDDDEDQI